MKIDKAMTNDKQYYGTPYITSLCKRFQINHLRFISEFSSYRPDYLHVYDGPNANAGMITSITGNDLPDDLYSTGSDIFLHFQSDDYTDDYKDDVSTI